MAGAFNQLDNKSFAYLIDDVLLDDLDQSNNMSLDEWIEDFIFDDSDMRQLQLILEKYRQNSSSKSHRTLDKDCKAGHECLFSDYFAPNLVYPPETFRQRFWMGKNVFLHIVEALSTVDPYFWQRVNATGKKGLFSLQKCRAAMRMLAYGVLADAIDDYV